MRRHNGTITILSSFFLFLLVLIIPQSFSFEFTAEYQNQEHQSDYIRGDDLLPELSSIGYVVGVLPEFTELSIPQHGGYMVSMTATNGQHFDCLLPDLRSPFLSDSDRSATDQPESSTSTPIQELPMIIKDNFQEECFVKTKGWWTYEVCPFGKISQFHLEGKGKSAVRQSIFSLGSYVDRPIEQEARAGTYTQFYDSG